MWAVNHQELLQHFKQQLGIFNESQTVDCDSEEDEVGVGKKRRKKFSSTENLDRWAAKLEMESLTMKANLTDFLEDFREELKKWNKQNDKVTDRGSLMNLHKKLDDCLKSVESTNLQNQKIIEKLNNLDERLVYIEKGITQYQSKFPVKTPKVSNEFMTPSQNRILIPLDEIPRFRRSK